MCCVMNTECEKNRHYETAVTKRSLPGENRFCTQDYVSESVYEARCPDLVMKIEYSACYAGENWLVTRVFVVPGVH